MGFPRSPYGGRKVAATGIAWYRGEDYDACKSLMADRDKLPPTFKDWLSKALEGEKAGEKRGHKIIRAIIDPVEFPKWCAANGITVLDQHARAFFASWKAAGSPSK